MTSGPVATPSTGSPEDLRRRLADACHARRVRPIREVAEALAATAHAWAGAAPLRLALPDVARLSPAMVAEVLPIVGAAITVDAMCMLAESAFGAGAVDRPPPAGPTLVAHVLASNVPALAVPAIALALLGGAAVAVKSGRADPLSAPAFRDALAAVHPGLAATVVTPYWPGGTTALDTCLAEAADVLIVTGRDATLSALAPHARGSVRGHGERTSVVAVTRAAVADLDGLAGRIADDVALYDQRGCLSPQAVYVETAERRVLEALADRLLVALGRREITWPSGPRTLEERAAHRTWCAAMEWDGVPLRSTTGGLVAIAADPTFRPGTGHRVVTLHPIASLERLTDVLPPGRIECIGLAGEATSLVGAWRRLGVSRICPPGRMQRPPLAWPRGQVVALPHLSGPTDPPACLVEA